MKPEYYITGASGFIGRHLCKYLEGESIHKHDCINGSKPFIFINLAAYGNHYFQDDPVKIVQANITDLMKRVANARTDKLVKFYNISTSSVTLPVQTVYSASKLFGEAFINSLKDKRFVNIRPYSVYGFAEAMHRFIPTVIRCLKSGQLMQLDPLPRHDWICVDDFIKAMFDGHTEIGTGVQHSNGEVVKMLEQISGKRLIYEETKGLRRYDNNHWVCPKGVPHRHLYEGLKQVYDNS